MKIVFLGTPDFATVVLESLISSNHEVVAVVTQPDKLVGRKQILTESPVKKLAKSKGVKVLQYNKIRKEGVLDLKNLNADLFVTCAFGQILSQEILDSAKFGTINVHFSLLPNYRGASPVQWALINGEKKIGVTIMKTDVGIDTGDIIVQKELEVLDDDNCETLLYKLAKLSCPLLLDVISQIENQQIKYIPQGDGFTYYPMLKKEDGRIDFSLSSEKLVNLIKGLYIWPNAYCYINDKMLKIFKGESVDFFGGATFGEIVCADKNGLIMKCGTGYLKILELQLEGGKRLDYKSFLNGNKLEVGKILS